MALRPDRWCEYEPHTLMGLLMQKKKKNQDLLAVQDLFIANTSAHTPGHWKNTTYNLVLLPPASTSTKCHFSVILLFSKADTPLLIKMEG